MLAGFPALAYADLDEGQAALAEGKTAYDRGDYVTAFREFKGVAEQGNAVAQFAVGSMYYRAERRAEGLPGGGEVVR